MKQVNPFLIVAIIIVSIYFAKIFIQYNSREKIISTQPEVTVEQSNKARDDRVMMNSNVLLNTFEMYRAANDHYPWQQNKNSNNPNQMININSANWMESMYDTGELKNSFRDNFLNLNDKYTLYVDGADHYVCFNPKSKDAMKAAKTGCVIDAKISNTNLCLNNSEQLCVPNFLHLQPKSPN